MNIARLINPIAPVRLSMRKKLNTKYIVIKRSKFPIEIVLMKYIHLAILKILIKQCRFRFHIKVVDSFVEFVLTSVCGIAITLAKPHEGICVCAVQCVRGSCSRYIGKLCVYVCA